MIHGTIVVYFNSIIKILIIIFKDSSEGMIQVVKESLNNTTDPKATDKHGSTPLILGFFTNYLFYLIHKSYFVYSFQFGKT